MSRKKDSGESCRASPSVHHCTVAPPTPSAGGRAVVHRKVKEAVNSLKSAASGLTPAKGRQIPPSEIRH